MGVNMRSAWIGAAGAALVVTWSLGFVGCSGKSSAGGQPGDGGGDVTSMDDGGVDAPAEGGMPEGGGLCTDQDPNTYPAMHQPIPQIDYNGGPVLTNPQIVTVTFTGYPHTQAMRAFDHAITSTSWWQQATAGYCTDKQMTNCVGNGSATTPDGGGFWHPDGSTDDAGDGNYDVDLDYDFPSMNIDDQTDIQPWLAKHI